MAGLQKRNIGLVGFSELDKALEELIEPKFRKAALRKAGKEAMKPVLNAAKKDAPILKNVDDADDNLRGQLKDDIKMSTTVNIDPSVGKNGKIKNSKKHELKVVVKTGKKTEDYALVTEFGRDEYTVKRFHYFGKATDGYDVKIGAIQPRPFMGPALHNRVELVLEIFKKELGDSIIKQAKKQKKAKE